MTNEELKAIEADRKEHLDSWSAIVSPRRDPWTEDSCRAVWDRHNDACKLPGNQIEVIDVLVAEVRKRREEVAKIVDVANSHGWNGVENSKILWDFLDYELSEVGRLKSLCRRAKVALQPRWPDACPGCGVGEEAEEITHKPDCLYVALNRVGFD